MQQEYADKARDREERESRAKFFMIVQQRLYDFSYSQNTRMH